MNEKMKEWTYQRTKKQTNQHKNKQQINKMDGRIGWMGGWTTG